MKRYTLLTLLIALMVLDIITTYYALHLGFIEGNPILAPIAHTPYLMAVKLIGVGAIVLVAYHADRIMPGKGGSAVLIAGMVPTLPAVVNNLVQLGGF
jgi:hypothetical protein